MTKCTSKFSRKKTKLTCTVQIQQTTPKENSTILTLPILFLLFYFFWLNQMKKTLAVPQVSIKYLNIKEARKKRREE